jgi:hypothetical protein
MSREMSSELVDNVMMWKAEPRRAWGGMFAAYEGTIMWQASHGVNPVEGLLGPVEVLKAAPVEYAVSFAFLRCVRR